MGDPVLRRLLAEPGMNTRLARALNITTGAVSQWKRVPISRVRAVSALTGVPAWELRPDFYDPPPLPPIRRVSVAT
jgi:pyruvate kinase